MASSFRSPINMGRSRAVIGVESWGGFGNVMLTACHIASFAIENNFRLLLLPLFRFAAFLEHFEANPFCAFPPKNSITLSPLVRELVFKTCRKTQRMIAHSPIAQSVAIYTLAPEELCSLEDGKVAEEIARKKFAIFTGFRFRAWECVKKHRSELVDCFAFKSEYKEKARSLARSYRAGGRLLVGVHCRGGDYRDHCGGEYYFTSSQYEALINHMRELLHPHEAVFLVATHDDTYRRQIRTPDTIFASGDLVEDLSILAECDYIFGPPSSFSLWAAFIGTVPYHHCKSGEERFTLGDFEISEDLGYWLDVKQSQKGA